MTATLRSPFNLSAHLRPTIGDQKMTFVNADHMGWMLCDGRVVSRVTYALLFNVIGTTFGLGDGSTTFKLPDFRGVVPGMAGRPNSNQFDQTINNVSYVRGDTVGGQRHKLNIDEMPSHTHGSVGVSGNTNGNGFTTLNGAHGHTGTTGNNNTNVVSGGGIQTNDTTNTGGLIPNNNYTTSLISTPHTHTFTTNTESNHQHQIFNTGGSNYHNNMQPTLFAGNMFIYSGRNMDGYFPYTWVGGIPAPDGTAPTPDSVLIF